MQTLLGALAATAPFAILIGLFAGMNRRAQLQTDVRQRQISLTDALHERLGAIVAPVVRRRRGGWQVHIAVPLERPALTEALLPIMLESFAPSDRDRRPLEIVLTRQVPVTGMPARTPTGADKVRQESLSWI
jgi:hypothetical protein